ncbi:MAG: glycosyltransferase family 4 protein, partial [Cyclobacteriaceae bacterium]|nr:glycosyltransferase family 4 protein [Cyclobacteriaceae bacterium]
TQEDFLAGSTYSVSYLAKGLASRGHKVIVAARSGSELSRILIDSQVIFESIKIRGRFDFKSIILLNRLIKKHAIQIVNAQSSKDRYISVFAKYFFRLRIILIHTRRQVSKSTGGFFQNLIYVSGTDMIVAVSKGVKQSLIENHIPEKHIEVIYNGTPSYKYQHVDMNETLSLKKRFSVNEGDLVIGSISRRKQQEQLLKALDLIGKPVTVFLLGIKEDDELRDIISSYKFPHKVIFVGEVEQKEALNYYRVFTCTVLCSTSEGLSQNLLESMFLGVPVIATAAAGNLDLIDNGINGLLFKDNDIAALANSIRLIEENPDMRNTLISGGITTATDTFSIERTIATYESFYARLLSSRNY